MIKYKFISITILFYSEQMGVHTKDRLSRKRSTKGGPSCFSFYFFESGPNPARTSNSGRFLGIGEK